MPIYRYRCTKCGREEEHLATLKEGAPKSDYCDAPIARPVFSTRDSWIEDAPNPAPLETDTMPCQGIMKRVYDKFHFHISGR